MSAAEETLTPCGGQPGAGLTRPLRILFATHTPWTERLGVPRVSIELSRELERAGHRCSHYAAEEAFPRGLGRLGRFFTTPLYQWRFLSFLRKRGRDFDVVQVECYLAPFPRAAYAFKGILVAKSNGLPLFGERWRCSTECRLKRAVGVRGSWGGNSLRALSRLAQGGCWGAALRTLKAADVIHVLNGDEQAALADGFGLGHKVTLVPNGLSQPLLRALRAASTPLARAASPVVAFVGRWTLGKGQKEIPLLVRQVRQAYPLASFHLLGTGVSEEEVRSAFDPRDRGSIRVQPSFDPVELPGLLAPAKAGVFPSYVEGFGLGALEMMAAGLPVVAWDAPGPRSFVPKLAPALIVPAGNVEATASALIRLLQLPTEAYVALSHSAMEVAKGYTWQRSADCFLRSLQPFLACLEAGAGSRVLNSSYS